MSSLTPNMSVVDDKMLRRIITDKWGINTFLSAILFIVLVALFNCIFAPKIHASDRRVLLRRFLSKLNWTHIAMVIWSAAIIVMSFTETYWSIVWMAKRTGRLVVALMPAMYVLTLRPSPLPHTFYLQVLPLHKWLSRLVVILATFHGIAYIQIYKSQGTAFKLRQWENVLGYFALIAFVVTAVTAWSWYRRRAYPIFYAIHIVTAWGALPLICLHSRPPCNNYLLMCVGTLAYQVVFRWLRSTHLKLRVQACSQTLVVVDIPKAHLPKHFQKWSPGAHVRLGNSLWRPMTWLQASHPYTVASLETDPTLKMVIRKGNYPIKMRKTYSLGGPHRCFPPYLENQLTDGQVKRALFVIGGTGIAFGAPVLRYLRLYGVQCRLVWAIRDPYDAKILPMLGLHEDVLEHRIEIYYSGDRFVEDEPEDEDLEITTSDNCCQDEQEPLLNRSRMSRRLNTDHVLSQYAHSMYNSRAHLNLRLKSWLYGLSLDNDDCCCADRLIEASDESKSGVWVISTGHPKLVQDARVWAKNADVNFFEEEFTL